MSRQHAVLFFNILLQAYNLLQSHIRGWSYENWTSTSRARSGFPPFTELQGNYSDFTYLDQSGAMQLFLREAGMRINTAWSNHTTYHLEVKTTSGDYTDHFSVSPNQFKMVQSPREQLYHGCADYLQRCNHTTMIRAMCTSSSVSIILTITTRVLRYSPVPGVFSWMESLILNRPVESKSWIEEELEV